MKKLILLFILVISSFTISINLLAQENSTSKYIKDSTIINYLKGLKEMHVGYYGSTQNCKAYYVYALKYRYHWFLIINTGENVSLMCINPPVKDKKIDYPSAYFIEGLAQCYFLDYTKLKKRKRSVIDMDIYGYYKFNRFGRKVMKGLLLLEYPYYNKGFFGWKLDEEKAKEMAAQKAAEVVEPPKVETIKPEINENIPIEKK